MECWDAMGSYEMLRNAKGAKGAEGCYGMLRDAKGC